MVYVGDGHSWLNRYSSLEDILCDQMLAVLSENLSENGKTVRRDSPAWKSFWFSLYAACSNEWSSAAGSAEGSATTNGVPPTPEIPVPEPYFQVLCQTRCMDEPTRIQYLYRIQLSTGGATNGEDRLLWTSWETVPKPKTTAPAN